MEQVLTKLEESGTSQLYLVGGAGTLRAAQYLKNLVRERGLCCSVVVIPTSIDNNIPFID